MDCCSGHRMADKLDAIGKSFFTASAVKLLENPQEFNESDADILDDMLEFYYLAAAGSLREADSKMLLFPELEKFKFNSKAAGAYSDFIEVFSSCELKKIFPASDEDFFVKIYSYISFFKKIKTKKKFSERNYGTLQELKIFWKKFQELSTQKMRQ